MNGSYVPSTLEKTFIVKYSNYGNLTYILLFGNPAFHFIEKEHLFNVLLNRIFYYNVRELKAGCTHTFLLVKHHIFVSKTYKQKYTHVYLNKYTVVISNYVRIPYSKRQRHHQRQEHDKVDTKHTNNTRTSATST